MAVLRRWRWPTSRRPWSGALTRSFPCHYRGRAASLTYAMRPRPHAIAANKGSRESGTIQTNIDHVHMLPTPQPPQSRSLGMPFIAISWLARSSSSVVECLALTLESVVPAILGALLPYRARARGRGIHGEHGDGGCES